MVAQLTYEKDPAVGFKGMISQNFTSPRQIDSGLAEGAILVGNGVEPGTAAGQYITLADAANFAGVAVYFAGIEKEVGATELELDDGKQLAVMSRGRVFAVAGGVIAKGAQIVPVAGADTKFIQLVGAITCKVRAVALTAAAADGDLIEIELSTQVLDTEV